jgi:hypothetical protein
MVVAAFLLVACGPPEASQPSQPAAAPSAPSRAACAPQTPVCGDTHLEFRATPAGIREALPGRDVPPCLPDPIAGAAVIGVSSVDQASYFTDDHDAIVVLLRMIDGTTRLERWRSGVAWQEPAASYPIHDVLMRPDAPFLAVRAAAAPTAVGTSRVQRIDDRLAIPGRDAVVLEAAETCSESTVAFGIGCVHSPDGYRDPLGADSTGRWARGPVCQVGMRPSGRTAIVATSVTDERLHLVIVDDCEDPRFYDDPRPSLSRDVALAVPFEDGPYFLENGFVAVNARHPAFFDTNGCPVEVGRWPEGRLFPMSQGVVVVDGATVTSLDDGGAGRWTVQFPEDVEILAAAPGPGRTATVLVGQRDGAAWLAQVDANGALTCAPP